MRHTPPRPIFKSCTSYARIRALRTPGHSLPVNRGSQHRDGRYIADDDQTRAVRCNPRDTGCLRWRNYFSWISWYKRAPMLALCSELIYDDGNFTFIQLWLIWRTRRGLFLHRRNLSADDPTPIQRCNDRSWCKSDSRVMNASRISSSLEKVRRGSVRSVPSQFSVIIQPRLNSRINRRAYSRVNNITPICLH